MKKFMHKGNVKEKVPITNELLLSAEQVFSLLVGPSGIKITGCSFAGSDAIKYLTGIPFKMTPKDSICTLESVRQLGLIFNQQSPNTTFSEASSNLIWQTKDWNMVSVLKVNNIQPSLGNMILDVTSTSASDKAFLILLQNKLSSIPVFDPQRKRYVGYIGTADFVSLFVMKYSSV